MAPALLTPNPAGFRRHPRAQRRALAGALEEIGVVAEIIVNVRTGHIIDGALRLDLALERGEPAVGVTLVDLSLDEERLAVATFDPLGALATTDTAKLGQLLASVQPTTAALRAMLAELAAKHGLAAGGFADRDAAGPLPDPASCGVVPGDLFRLGDHRLLCGDATDPAAIERLMAGERAVCIWTDVPFGVGIEGKTAARLRIANDEPATADAVFVGFLRIAPVEPSAPFYIVAPSGPRSLAFREALRDAGWRLHQELVWDKGAFTLGHGAYQLGHESILFGHAPGTGRPGRGNHPGSRWFGGNGESSVLRFPKPAASRLHPTMKPVGLVTATLKNSTEAGDVVFEPFAGSGSTLIGAAELGRRCYAIELDPRYVRVILDRFEAQTHTKAVRDG